MKPILLFSFVFFATFIFAQDYEIYVSDAGNFNNPPWQILKFDENGEQPEIFIDENLAWPQDILFVEDQDIVLISNLSSNLIARHHITTGAFIDNFAESIGGPTRMKIGPEGLLYVLQWTGNGKVKRYELNGTFVDDFTATGVSQSIGLDWDSDGNLYVSSYNGDHVRKFDSDGNDLGLFVNSNLAGPTNIWFDDSGDLLVTDYNGGAVKRFDPSGNYVSDFIQGLDFAEGVAFLPHVNLPDYNILIGNGGTSSVKLYNGNGDFIEDIISSGAGGLLTPNAIVVRQIIPVSVAELPVESLTVNPTLGTVFSITAPPLSGKGAPIYIRNCSGQIVGKLEAGLSSQWDATGFPAGVYFVTNGAEQEKVNSGNYCYTLNRLVRL